MRHVYNSKHFFVKSFINILCPTNMKFHYNFLINLRSGNVFKNVLRLDVGFPKSRIRCWRKNRSRGWSPNPELTLLAHIIYSGTPNIHVSRLKGSQRVNGSQQLSETQDSRLLRFVLMLPDLQMRLHARLLAPDFAHPNSS